MRTGYERYYFSNLLVSLLTGLFLLFSIFFSYAYLGFNVTETVIVIIISTLLYGLLLMVLASTSTPTHRTAAKIAGKTNNDIVNAIVNEVYGNSNGELKHDFVGNSKNKIYHKSECELALGIEPKYRLENTNEDFFKRRKFKKCKICFKKN